LDQGLCREDEAKAGYCPQIFCCGDLFIQIARAENNGKTASLRSQSTTQASLRSQSSR
jgi:hypothetical protein